MLDFNKFESQTAFELIPENTEAKVMMTLRPGGSGEGGWVRTFDSGWEALDAEFIILEGQFAKRKFWQMFGIGGPTEGHEKAMRISMAMLRSMLEASRGVDPHDESDAACNARKIDSLGELSGLEFWVKIGIEKGKDGYDPKNKIKTILHKKGGAAPVTAKPAAHTPPPAKKATTVPDWAQ